MKKLFILLLAISAMVGLHAGAIQDKYTGLENTDKHRTISDDVKKQVLEDNLTVGVRLSLLRYFKYCGYEGVKIADGQYERAKIHKFMYYVQFKEFTGFLIYENDPEKYLILPIDEKFYID